MPKKVRLVLLVLLIASAAIVPSWARKARPNNTLHEAARRAGGKVILRYKSNRSTIYSGVDELARSSDVIVIGRTLGHRPRLRPDGNFITEDFLVRVQEVIKGDAKIGRSIVISLPGGSYRFPDGTYVMVMPVDYQKAEDATTYVFFLKNKGTIYKGHQPTAETQGVFKLTKGTVEPTDLVATDPVVRRYRQMGTATFLAELHKAVPIDLTRKNNGAKK